MAQLSPRRPELRAPWRHEGPDRYHRPPDLGLREAGLGLGCPLAGHGQVQPEAGGGLTRLPRPVLVAAAQRCAGGPDVQFGQIMPTSWPARASSVDLRRLGRAEPTRRHRRAPPGPVPTVSENARIL